MTVDAVLFDFDGTLAHTEPAYRRAYREMMFRFAGVEVDERELIRFVNLTASEFAAMFPSKEMLVRFEEVYHETHHDSIEAIEGIPELLAALRAAGLPLAVVSLKPRRAGELELDLTGLRQYLDAAVWGDDGPRPKPAPDAAIEAASRLGVDPSRAIVVGDSASDIIMAEAAGIPAVGVLWGGAPRDRLVEAGAATLLETPGELLDLLS